MDYLFISIGTSSQAFASAVGYGLVGLVNVQRLLSSGINHPENFLNVVCHLLKFLLRGEKRPGGLAMLPMQVKQESAVHKDHRANRNEQHEQQQRGNVQSLQLGTEHDQRQDYSYDCSNYRKRPPHTAWYRLRRRLRAQRTS